MSPSYAPVPLPRSRRRGASTGTHVPLIERYHERLPFEPGDKLVSLQEGSTPLLRAPVLSEMVGATVRLKLEGANPTGSFKDRGMTCAVSAAVRDGAKAVICASTGNTAASAAAYAARAGITCAVIVPEGKIAQGKMAQTLVHGARVISLAGQLRPGADARARADRRRTRSCSSTRSTSSASKARRRPRSRSTRRSTAGSKRSASRSATPATSPPTGAAFARWAPRRGCSASRPRAPRRWSRATRSSTPKRSPARSASATPCAGRTRWRPRPTRAARSASVSDEEILARLPAAGLPRRHVLRARLGGLGRGPAQVRRRRRRADRLRAHRPRPEGPRDGDRQQRRAHHPVRRRDRRRSRKRCWVIP